MSQLSRNEMKQLAEDMAKSSPAPKWDSVEECLSMRYTVPGTGKKIDFSQAVELYKQLDDEVKEREARMKDIRESIQAAVMVSGKDKVICNEWRLTMISKSGTKKIVAEKLLSQGVKPEVIAKATEVGKASTYLKIDKANETEQL